MSEPGVKYDTDKPRWGLLPFEQVEEVVDVLTSGSKKYCDNNWKKVPDAEERYFDAMLRHVTQYRYGEKLDGETGKSHLAHAICCALFMMWFDDNKSPDIEPIPEKESPHAFDMSILTPLKNVAGVGKCSLTTDDSVSLTVKKSSIQKMIDKFQWQVDNGDFDFEDTKELGLDIYGYYGDNCEMFRFKLVEVDDNTNRIQVVKV